MLIKYLSLKKKNMVDVIHLNTLLGIGYNDNDIIKSLYLKLS